MKQGSVFIDGMVNSTEVVVHSKTNFVKVVQNHVVVPETNYDVRQLILQDRHVAYREMQTNLGISGTNIHSILHDHLTVKKFVSVAFHTFANRSKKGSCQLVERNAPKIRSRCFETRLRHRDR